MVLRRKNRVTYFYPRPPRGGRPASRPTGAPAGQFLSTPSARRATLKGLSWSHKLRGFLSTPSARRATYFFFVPCRLLWISIHALREEGDRGMAADIRVDGIFLSTPSARRATFSDSFFLFFLCISIHALREEGDQIQKGGVTMAHNFYPRPPRGGRRSRLRQCSTA